MCQLIMLVALLLVCSSRLVHGITSSTKHYIVYMGDKTHPTSEAAIASNQEFLSRVTTSKTRVGGIQRAIMHHYTKSFRGFSALLTPEEAASISNMDGVISVFESKTKHVYTTRSWDFLGIGAHNSEITLEDYSTESDVIVGVIDTGVWPESKSFDDRGLPPVPRRFKGKCETGDKFSASYCNRKIIGARFYSKGFEAENGPLESFGGIFFRSPRDSDGHGSHTASTAAGAVVENANLLGIASGTATGGAPGARLAIYKACWFNLCNDADLLAAFDDATDDGVDIISISVGPNPPQPSFFEDGQSIGSFHAFRKGILVCASAGNSGLPNTATNVAPWILTVAASSIDRDLDSDLVLGNGMNLKGEAINPLIQNGFAGLVPGSSAAAPGIPGVNASFCLNNTIDPTKVKGKIVVCTISSAIDDRTLKSAVVKEAGGVGIVVVDPIAKDVGFQFVIPGTIVGQKQGKDLMTYLASDKYPTAHIKMTSTVLNFKPAPQMAVFSSLGPNIITPEIIKPDVTAPGVSILAAWSPVAVGEAGGRSVDFNIISGTSMSCPHASGVAALIKSKHPTWSPAAIKSAIMTTAFVIDNTNKPILRSPNGAMTGPFDLGSGHIDPVAALDPGLFYDYDVNDAIDFLCSNGATPAQLRNLTGDKTTCMKNPSPSYNLNYPSIGVVNVKGKVSVTRTLTNCGNKASVYKALVQAPHGVDIVIVPNKLSFKKPGQKLSFRVNFTVKKKFPSGKFVFGSLSWSDGKHIVQSPIAINPTSVY